MTRLRTDLRRPLWILVGIVAISLIAELAARLILTATPEAIRWYDASAQLKIEQMDELDEVDIVFAGTSMAWQAFVPGEFDERAGTSSYNAGLNGGTPEVMERWLLEEVIPRTHPGTVVWGLSSYDLAPFYGPAQRDVYDDALASREGWLAAADQWGAGWSSLVANRTVLRSLDDVRGAGADQRRRDFARARDTLGPDGERRDFRVDTTESLRRITEARLRDFGVDGGDISTITRTVESLRAQGIAVVLVDLPVPQRFIDAHPGGSDGYRRTTQTLDALAVTLDVRLLRLTDGFETDDFIDFTHLSRASASRFTRIAAEAFSSDRDDRGTTPWTPSAEPVTTEPDGTDCRVETIEDEYGFEFEITLCADDLAGTDTRPPDSEADSQAMTDLTDGFLFRPCGDPIPDVEPPRVLDPAAQDAVTTALALLRESVSSCGTDSYGDAWSAAVAALEQASGIDRPINDPTSPTETASRAISAIDTLRATVLGSPKLSASWGWYHADELLASLELRRRATSSPVRAVAIGSSETIRALDPDTLDAYYGGDFLNIATAGADPEEWRILWPRVFAAAPPPTQVLWGVTSHRLLDPAGFDCSNMVAGSLRRSERYRADLFPDLREDHTVDEILFGPDIASTPATEGPAYAAGSGRYLSPGSIVMNTAPFSGVPSGERRYPDPTSCSERFDVWADAIGMIRESGAELRFVLLPLHPDVIALAPELHAQLRSEFLAFAEGEGVEVIVIDAPYEDSETGDGWHATPAGRARVTGALVEALEALTPPG